MSPQQNNQFGGPQPQGISHIPGMRQQQYAPNGGVPGGLPPPPANYSPLNGGRPQGQPPQNGPQPNGQGGLGGSGVNISNIRLPSGKIIQVRIDVQEMPDPAAAYPQ
jgi:hypothetical protein